MIALSAISLLTVSCSKQRQTSENVIKVKTVEASSTSIYGSENYSRTIEENSGVSLSFPVGGTIKQLNVAEGQSVGAGQLVAVLDATTLGNLVSASSAAVGQAQAEKSAAQALDAYKRMKQLHDNGSLPEIKWVEVQTQYQQAQDAVNQVRQQVNQAEAAVQSAKAQKNISLKNLHDTRLYAPSIGYIAKKMTDAGQNVAPGQPIAMLVNIRQVKVKINVPEDDIAKIHIGQVFRFTISSLPGQTFTARVTEKGVSADPVTRSYEVKAVADNAGRKLLPGMICDVYVQQSNNTSVIALPANIIQIDIDNRPFVWTVVGGVAKKTPITIGQSIGDNVQIIGGLSSKDHVIIEGQQKVSNGMKVKE